MSAQRRVTVEQAREHVEYWNRYAAQRSLSPWEATMRACAADLLDARAEIERLRAVLVPMVAEFHRRNDGTTFDAYSTEHCAMELKMAYAPVKGLPTLAQIEAALGEDKS